MKFAYRNNQNVIDVVYQRYGYQVLTIERHSIVGFSENIQ